MSEAKENNFEALQHWCIHDGRPCMPVQLRDFYPTFEINVKYNYKSGIHTAPVDSIAWETVSEWRFKSPPPSAPVDYFLDDTEREESGLNKKPSEQQVGGSHYKNLAIQPAEYVYRNELGFLEGSAIKYITRHKSKNGAQDVKKAIHFLQLLLEYEYGL